jgi:cobalt/nickel transport system ATP-binding protein
LEIVNLHKISYTYPNGSIGLKDVSFKILSGSKIALVGANGSGKTTLLLLLNALIKPNTGKLKMFGEELSYSRKALFQLRKKIGFVMQESDYQLFAPSVYEEISFGLSNVMNDKAEVRKIVSQVLEQFNLSHLSEETPQSLSTGQKNG